MKELLFFVYICLCPVLLVNQLTKELLINKHDTNIQLS